MKLSGKASPCGRAHGVDDGSKALATEEDCSAGSLAVNLNDPVSTERLLLRPVRQADLDSFTRLQSDPDVVQHLPHPSPPTAEDLAMSLQAEIALVESGDHTLLWGIQYHDDPTLIGHVGIWPREGEPSRAELIIVVSPAHWRQGIGTEACAAAMSRWLQVFPESIIYAAVNPDNIASRSLMRKLGLTQEFAGDQYPGIHEADTRVFVRPHDTP